MADEEISIEIKLEDGTIKRQVVKIEQDAKKSGKKIGNNLGDGLESGISKSLAGVATRIVAIGGAIAAALGGRAAIAASSRQQDAVNSLNTALRLSGKFSEEASRGVQNFTSELQKNSTIGDEVALETAALIQSLGQLEVNALIPATQAAADLSAALGIDLNAAALLVGKAAAGEVSSFSRFGLIIQKGANTTETFAKALDAINSKFGGAAASKINTFSGAYEQLSNIFGDLLELLGDFITKSPTIIQTFKFISGEILRFSSSLGSVREFNVNLNATIKTMLFFADIFVSGVIAPLELAFNLVKSTLSLITNTIRGFTQIFAVVGSTLASGFVSAFSSTGKAATALKDFSDNALNNFNTFVDGAKNSFDSVFEFDVAGSAAGFIERYNAVLDEVVTTTEIANSKVKDSTSNTLIDLSKQYRDFATQSISQGVAAIGAALVKGENGFAAFGKTVLGIVGDLAIQIGTTLVGIGLGIDSLKASLTTLTGGFAVAAGLALIAVGGALKALSGGAGGLGTAAVGGAGSGVVAGGEEQAPFLQPSESEIEKQTQVNINVEGTVLSPNDVGLQIAQILQETFDTNGTTIVTA